MKPKFRIGLTKDFEEQVPEAYEKYFKPLIGTVPTLQCELMPADNPRSPSRALLDQYDAIINLGWWIPKESVQGATRLTLIARWGVGYDRIDVAALTENDIALTITPNAVRGPMAEADLTLILGLAKNLTFQDRLVRRGLWRDQLPRYGICIEGKILGSLGLGNIASEMFRRARSMGFARFLACDPYAPPSRFETLGVEPVSLEELFRQSDFLTIHVPLNQETHHLVNERLLRLMKPTAFLINTARGPIVDEKALIKALKEGWIAGAGLDVFEQEPPPPNHPLFTMDNVILAPHSLGWTHELFRANTQETVEAVRAVASGKVPSNIVNSEVIEREGFKRKLQRFKEAA